jgi:hypothetical protein
MAYIGASPSNGVRRKHTYTATASQTTFSGAGSEGISLSYRDSNYVDVYVNGVKLGDADYTATSGTSIVLAVGAAVNDIVEIITYDVFSIADTVSKADGGTFDGNVAMAGTLDVTGDLTVDTSTLHVDSANNRVGVGETAPFAKLHISDTQTGRTSAGATGDLLVLEDDNNGMSILSSNSGQGHILFGDVDDGAAGAIAYDHSSDNLRFRTNSAWDRMILDSSGNLLVGTTTVNPADNNDASGSQLSSVGSIQASISNATTAIFNRGNDGAIIALLGSGVSRGSIGINNARPYMASNDSGLKFKNADITACTSAGADKDGSVSLGASGARFQDLYLSGGVVFGSTSGSVTSKTLDDYEEGVWYPNIGGTATYNSQIGHYVRVGDIVHVTANMHINVRGTGSPTVIQGLPFTSYNQNAPQGAVNVMYYSGISTSMIWVTGYVVHNNTYMYFSGNTVSSTTIQHNTQNMFQDNTRIDFSATYRAN